MSGNQRSTIGQRLFWIGFEVAAWMMAGFLLLIFFLLPGVGRGRIPASSEIWIKQITGSALRHNSYEGFLVNDIHSNTGLALHSWETALLPYLNCKDLHEQIDLSQPWNAEINQEAMKTPSIVYENPDLQHQSPIQNGTGFALSHYSANSRVFLDQTLRTMNNFEQQCGKTILFGEVQEGFMPWGEPGNVRDPAVGLNEAGGFGHPRKNTVYFGFGDGHVEAIDAKIDPKVLETMATPDEQEF